MPAGPPPTTQACTFSTLSIRGLPLALEHSIAYVLGFAPFDERGARGRDVVDEVLERPLGHARCQCGIDELAEGQQRYVVPPAEPKYRAARTHCVHADRTVERGER